jgi:hypothetical protein
MSQFEFFQVTEDWAVDELEDLYEMSCSICSPGLLGFRTLIC